MTNVKDLIRACVENRQGVYTYGPPGTGKTTMAQDILAEVCGGADNVFSITCHEDMSAQELVGMYKPKGSEYIWHDGPMLRAWRLGGGLLFNEIDKAAGPVWTSLYAACDDPKVARLTLPTGETVRPHPRFRYMATSNQPIDTLPDGLRDRFPVTVPFMCPTPEQVKSLPETLGHVAIDAYANAKFPHITFRKLQAWAQVAGSKNDDRALTPEEQVELSQWIFGRYAREVHAALTLASKR